MTVVDRIIRNYKPADMYMVRLKEVGNSMFKPVAGYTVIPDQRVSQHKDLTFVGRICQAFRVAGHGGVEHYFTCYRAFGTELYPFQPFAVSKG